MNLLLLAFIESAPVTVVLTGLGVLLAFYLQLAALKKNLAADIIQQVKAEQSDANGGKLPQPLSVQFAREFASADGLKNHAAKIHGRADALDSRINKVVADVNVDLTEIKVHLAKMDERSAANHQQLIAFGERLNHVAEDIAALRGRKHA